MIRFFICVLSCALFYSPLVHGQQTSQAEPFTPPTMIFGFRDPAPELKAEKMFLAVPDPQLAREHLKVLTSAPHVAGSPEDLKTAEYVLEKYKAAGLDAYIQRYKVWMNLPLDIKVEVVAPKGVTMIGPSPEHVSDDPYQDDPRILPAYNEFSPSGDVTADVVYANYGRLEDFKKLQEMGVDVKGKIVIVRYGENFRGVKSFVAEQVWSGGRHHLLRSMGRRLFQRRQVSQGAMASRYRCAAWIHPIPVPLSRGSHDAGDRFRARAA